MLAYVFSKLVTLTYGLMYPAYCSYKAVKTKDVREYVHWMMYWIAFAVFTVFEVFADTFIGCWFPFYYEGKIVFLIWMISSSTRGGAIMYRRYIHPTLTQHEAEIDACLADFKVKASGALMTWGYKFVTSVTEVVMTATVRAGEPMMDHFRRTYSMNDLNRGSNPHFRAAANNRPGGDYTDGFMPRSISGDLHFERNLPVQTVPAPMELEETVLIEELPQETRAGPSSDGSSPEIFPAANAEVRRVRTRSRTRKPPADMGDRADASSNNRRRVKTKKTTERSTEKTA